MGRRRAGACRTHSTALPLACRLDTAPAPPSNTLFPLPLNPQALNKAAEAAGASIKGEGAEDAARYVAGMAANLIDVKNFEEGEWTQVRPSCCPAACFLLLVAWRHVLGLGAATCSGAGGAALRQVLRCALRCRGACACRASPVANPTPPCPALPPRSLWCPT